jgi:hypothetical protein
MAHYICIVQDARISRCANNSKDARKSMSASNSNARNSRNINNTRNASNSKEACNSGDANNSSNLSPGLWWVEGTMYSEDKIKRIINRTITFGQIDIKSNESTVAGEKAL